MYSQDKHIIVITGMQRSGTSLMMQLLKTAGLELYTDNKKQADQYNPYGYYEHSNLKGLRKDSSFLEAARGKCIKVYLRDIEYLPKQYSYKFIFMKREINEVLSSMKKVRQGLPNNHMEKAYVSEHLNTLSQKNELALSVIKNQFNADCITIKFRNLINLSKAEIKKLENFINIENGIQHLTSVFDYSIVNIETKKILLLDRAPRAIQQLILRYAKGKTFCEIGIGEGDNLSELKGTKEKFGIEKSSYGVKRCLQKYPDLKIIHGDVLLYLDKIKFDVCYLWIAYPINKMIVNQILKKHPNATILMGINYYFHLPKDDPKYQLYVKLYNPATNAEKWNDYAKGHIEELRSSGYVVSIDQTKEEESGTIFNVAVISKKRIL